VKKPNGPEASPRRVRGDIRLQAFERQASHTTVLEFYLIL